MTHESVLEIKYKKIFPIFFLICSLFILYAALVVGFTPNSILALVLLPMSILMLIRPTIVITQSTIQMKNLLGMTVKEHPYLPEQLSIRSGNVFVNEKKIFATWWTDTNTRQLRAFLEESIR